MKKLVIAALIAGVSAASMAAEADGSYVSVAVGSSEYKFDSDKEHHTGFTLAYGQSISEFAGYEVGYANLGKFDVGGSGQAIYLAGVGKYEFAQGFSVFGKIGPTVNYYSGGSGDSETRVRLLLGAGVGYQFDKNWAATLEYTHFGESLGLTPSLWSVGARYHF